MELKFENGSSIQFIDSGTNKRSIRGIEELQQRVNEFYNSDSVTIVKDKTVYILPVKDQPIKLVTNDISIKSDDGINFYARKKITFFELCKLLQPEDPYTLYEEFVHKKIGIWKTEGEILDG